MIPDPNTLLIGSAEVKLQLSMDNETLTIPQLLATLPRAAPLLTYRRHAFRFRTSTADGSADNAALIKVFLQ